MRALSSIGSCLITDPGIPTLAQAVDPVVLGESLPAVLPSEWGAIKDVRLRMLKHHPGKRCTFAIALGTPTGGHSLIGKVYATDRADVHEATEAIRKAGFDQDAAFSIPRPYGYCSELRLLLQENVAGIRAKELLLQGSARERAVTADRCARWLARFHANAPQAGPVLDITKQLVTMERWSRRIAEVAAASAGKAARLFDRLAGAASRARSTDLRAGHGSYSPAQIILAQDRTITFDWDSYDVADPCRDVARFSVSLQRLALKYLGSFQALDGAVEVFMNTYMATADSDMSRRLPFHKAAIFLGRARRDVDEQDRGWPERVEATLDEGLRILEDPASHGGGNGAPCVHSAPPAHA